MAANVSAANIITGTAWQNAGCTCMARVVGNNGAQITPASVASCTWDVVNESGPSGPVTVVPTTPLVPQNVIFNTLRLDGGWAVDNIGWNVAIIVPATTFTQGNANYRVELWLNPADQTPLITVQWDPFARKTYGPTVV